MTIVICKLTAPPSTWYPDTVYFIKNGNKTEVKVTDAASTPHSLVALGLGNTVIGDALVRASDAAAARAAIGAGTSSLTLGTTAETAKAGDYTPDFSEIRNKPMTYTPSGHSHAPGDVGAAPAGSTLNLTGNQTAAGEKTFSDLFTANASINVTGNVIATGYMSFQSDVREKFNIRPIPFEHLEVMETASKPSGITRLLASDQRSRTLFPRRRLITSWASSFTTKKEKRLGGLTPS